MAEAPPNNQKNQPGGQVKQNPPAQKPMISFGDIGCVVAAAVPFIGMILAFSMAGSLLGTNSLSGSGTNGTTMDCSGAAKVPAQDYSWVQDAASKYLNGDTAALIALIQTESGWNPTNTNKASSAAGLGQFLYGTAKGMPYFVGGNDKTGTNWPGGNVYPGQPASNPNDARFDPERSIYASAEYLGSFMKGSASPGDAYQNGYVGGAAGAKYAQDARARFDKYYATVKQGCTVSNVSAAGAQGVGCGNVPVYLQCGQSYSSNGILGNPPKTTICGAGCMYAATAMVLKYYGADVDPGTVAEHSRLAGLENVNGVNGKYWPNIGVSWGIHQIADSTSSSGSWALAQTYLAKGTPVIVYGQGGPPFSQRGHFVVLTCYNAAAGTVSVNDPARHNGLATGEYPVRAITDSILRAHVFSK